MAPCRLAIRGLQLDCCQAAYGKIKHPDRFLTTAEKIVIAMVYELEVGYLFPELEGIL